MTARRSVAGGLTATDARRIAKATAALERDGPPMHSLPRTRLVTYPTDSTQNETRSEDMDWPPDPDRIAAFIGHVAANRRGAADVAAVRMTPREGAGPAGHEPDRVDVWATASERGKPADPDGWTVGLTQTVRYARIDNVDRSYLATPGIDDAGTPRRWIANCLRFHGEDVTTARANVDASGEGTLGCWARMRDLYHNWAFNGNTNGMPDGRVAVVAELREGEPSAEDLATEAEHDDQVALPPIGPNERQRMQLIVRQHDRPSEGATVEDAYRVTWQSTQPTALLVNRTTAATLMAQLTNAMAPTVRVTTRGETGR